jgi:two-component system cell cycle response regulator
MSGRLLIVDGLASRRARMGAGLEAARYEVALCGSAAEAGAAVDAGPPDVVLLDLGEATGPDAAPGAARAVRALRDGGLERHGHAPPILALAAPDRADLRLAALDEGAEAAMDRATPDVLLLARIRALIRARDAERELRLPLEEEGLGAGMGTGLGAGMGTGLMAGPGAGLGAATSPGVPGLAEASAPFLAPRAAGPAQGAKAGSGGAPLGALAGWPAAPAPFRATLISTDRSAEAPGAEPGARPAGRADAAPGPAATGPGPGTDPGTGPGTGPDAAAALLRLARLLGRELRLDRAPADGVPSLAPGPTPGPAGGRGEPAPDLVLIDARGLRGDPGPASEAIRRLIEIACQSSTRRAATALLLPAHAVETAALALDLGAGEVIAGQPAADEAAARLAALMRRRAEGLRLRERIRSHLEAAVRDPLTGLHNRRYAEPALCRMAERARRSGRPLAVLILDIDHFKAVNDRWGHAAGDRVLAEVARRLRAWLPEEALVARIGGEEFLVALPDAGPEGARAAADALRARIAARAFPLDGVRGLAGTAGGVGAGRDAEVRVTVSVGVATSADVPGAAGSFGPTRLRSEARAEVREEAQGEARADLPPCPLAVADLMARADAALFAAKDAGRDTVALAMGMA